MKYDKFNLILDSLEPSSKFIETDTTAGLEIYATVNINIGDTIGTIANEVEGKKLYTRLGKIISKSEDPNSAMKKDGDETILVATKDIHKGVLLTAPYEKEEEVPPINLDIVETNYDELKTRLETEVIRITPHFDVEIGKIYLTPWGDKVKVVNLSPPTIDKYRGPVLVDEDPLNAWKTETNLEILPTEAPFGKFEQSWENWELMSPEMQTLSDKKSIEMFGETNRQRFENIKKKLLAECIMWHANDNGYSLILEADVTFYDLRNLIYLLLRKVRKSVTKEVLKDLVQSMVSYETRQIPLQGLKKIVSTSPSAINKRLY